MVEEAVEHGGGDRAITVEDGSPLFEGFVGGKYDRTAFVARVEERRIVAFGATAWKRVVKLP